MKNYILTVFILVVIVTAFTGCAPINIQSSANLPTQTSQQASTTLTTSLTSQQSSMALIPGGDYKMGDHNGFVDSQHPSDEIPIHNVSISQFYMDKFDVTNSEYCNFLNSAFSQGLIKVSDGLLYLSNSKDVLFQTRQADQYSRINWDGSHFTVLENRGNHPVTSVMWCGAAAYCNWLSAKDGYQACYNTVYMGL